MRSTLLAIAGLLLIAPAADAAVVQLRPIGGSGKQLQVTRLPGERNALALGQPGGGTIVITDPGAPLAPGQDCVGGATEVRCTVPPGIEPVVVITGGTVDGSVSLAQMQSYLRGEIWGGSGAETLVGGPGRDDLFAGAGDDVLEGGAGNDRLDPGLGVNVLRGGAGRDLAWYTGRTSRTVMLGGSLDGADDIGIDVEDVTTGDAADRIVGSDLRNVIQSGRGADDIDGRGGDDLINSFGRARLVGGAGRDRIEAHRRSASIDARDGEVDRVWCREGLARAPLADPIDRLMRCVPLVQVRTAEQLRPRLPVAASGRLRIRLGCRAIGQPCLVHLAVRHGGSDLARRSVRMPAGIDSHAMRLDTDARHRLERRRELDACVQAVSYRTTPAPSTGWAGCVRVTLVRAP